MGGRTGLGCAAEGQFDRMPAKYVGTTFGIPAERYRLDLFTRTTALLGTIPGIRQLNEAKVELALRMGRAGPCVEVQQSLRQRRRKTSRSCGKERNG